MAKGYILYNPLAADATAGTYAGTVELPGADELEFYDMTRITNYSAFLSGLEKDGRLLIVGGDGTLNRFVNDTKGISIPQRILYCPVGTRLDFARDLGLRPSCAPVDITEHLKGLPWVEVNGKHYRFLTGVSFGIDSFCCHTAEELKKASGGKKDLSPMPVRKFLSRFDTRNATVTVDGTQFTYTNVWMAPTLYGRYCCGAMAAPMQKRENEDRTLSLMLLHNSGKLRTLFLLPKLTKGTHIQETEQVTIHTGQRITVEFDRPTPLLIDGETIPDVKRYTVSAAVDHMKAGK